MTTQAAIEDQAVARRWRLRKYTTWVEKLCGEDPGARSALRTGLRRGMDDVRRMHRFITPWLPENRHVGDDEQRAYYAVAAMIASQPRNSYPQAEAADDKTEAGTAAQADTGAERKKGPERYGDSLGRAFATAVGQSPGRDKEMQEATAETRLNLLTRQSVDGLHRHLPSAVGYLRSLDVPVDWAQLLDDLVAWPTHSGRIARRWLQDYYRLRAEAARKQAAQADQHEAEETGPNQ
ncbi:type I-E CRISPR-associated protein Cse2/CasB [Streptomyces gilvosporeus]|uniref:Type I-E CRISPR-associated protein Cse2/CasB n=1 Tax=Streptomyces gilvosporeus TaxID=553510 RepID=A0A1V0TZG6_9ACTN|nr:type I-E CRISPR-associated protein Cse2/CasB [Streptomyces gilvosporeus]ARF58336.1 type I-E CRISPR-associated protein Cse2/CasB [Streptomyces gilvosporeus]